MGEELYLWIPDKKPMGIMNDMDTKIDRKIKEVLYFLNFLFSREICIFFSSDYLFECHLRVGPYPSLSF